MTPKEQTKLRQVDPTELAHFRRYVQTGQLIKHGSPEMAMSAKMTARANLILAEISTGYHDHQEIQAALSELTCRPVDSTVTVILPFTTDFGANIKFGKHIYVNAGVAMQDQGGITIDDGALIGHHVVLATLNHGLDAAHRHDLIPAPIHICKNAWIGANTTILQGVTVGENSVVAAGAVVTKDVPANTVVAGVPARVIKQIEN
ncbi:DapH/DapD/GlmU-related protein [Limosilactobacillus kribbianus]|uniref:DapH/DapD/GlmU-related protein n=1 Tax=Limosilactobacillus kribbianus TaxID=2982695 RepID=UPI00272E9964|nr:DapH/DapD/GlmU-related protein [Limosilactobacillus kribbianus]